LTYKAKEYAHPACPKAQREGEIGEVKLLGTLLYNCGLSNTKSTNYRNGNMIDASVIVME
jgi:hypothetical protein